MNETKGYLTLKDKSQIYYEISGSGDEILFLLHGNSGDLTYLDHQSAAFGKFFRIIRFDYRDHGKSVNAHSKLSLSILVEDLKEIFDYFCVKRADILGFSDGANLAVKFALACPEHVNHLILNAPNLKFEGLNFITQIAAIIWHRISKILPFMEKMHRVSGLLVEDLQVGEHDLSKINSKTLFLVGPFDLIRLEHILILSRLVKNSAYRVLPGQGHQAARKDPEKFNRIVLAFLGKR